MTTTGVSTGASRVFGVILAAGSSSRMAEANQRKQLIPIDGKPLLRHIAERALASRCERLAIVIGAHLDEIAASVVELTESGALTILTNEEWSEGMASSLRVAVAWASPPLGALLPTPGSTSASLRSSSSTNAEACEALLVMLCDQPHLTTQHIDALIGRFEQATSSSSSSSSPTPTSVASAYDGIVGVPAVLHRSLFPELAALHGDQGARALLKKHDAAVIKVAWPEGAIDVDSPGDVEDFRSKRMPS